MNLYDLVVIVLVVLLAWRGLRVGLVGALLAWVAFGVGLFLAFRFDGVVGGWLAHLHGFAATTWRVLAFVAILVIVEVAAGWLARMLGRTLAHLPILGRLNRLGGVLLGALLALVLVWLVTAALLFAPSSLVPLSNAVHHSETVHVMRAMTPRWERSLRAYLDNLTTGHMSPRLQQQLRQLTGARAGKSSLP
jgi:membrane protein required for colicin V production